MRGACLAALALLVAAGMAGAGVVSFGPALSDDASTGISTLVFYTHKVAGGEAQAINGVSLTALTTAANPPNFAWADNGGGKNQIVNNNNNWQPATGGVTGPGLLELLDDFTYSGNGANPGAHQTFTLSGLTVGKTYDLRLYIRPWDQGGSGRPIDFTFTHGSEVDKESIWEDKPVLQSYPSPHSAYYLDYQYTAQGTSLVIDAAVPGTAPTPSGSLHLYGMTNQLIPESPAGPEVLYREVFPNTTGANQAPSYAGWNAHGGPTATALANSAQIGVSNMEGRPNNLPAVNSFPISAQQINGLFSDWGTSTSGGNQRLFWTDEVPIDLSVFSLEQAQWYQGNANGSDGFRVAVELDDTQWYTSVLRFTNAALSSGANFPTAAELKTFDFEGAEWYQLNFTPGSLLELVTAGGPFDLPEGSFVTGFGLFDENRLSTLRFDSFELTVGPAAVIPEPATVALLGLGLAALARRRSSRRRDRVAIRPE